MRGGQASRPGRAPTWWCRFGGHPVRGTEHHVVTPRFRGATLGITANTGNPSACAADRPDTMDGSYLLPVMHWNNARRACGGVCALFQLRRSETGFALAVRNLQRSMRRCAVKLLF